MNKVHITKLNKAKPHNKPKLPATTTKQVIQPQSKITSHNHTTNQNYQSQLHNKPKLPVTTTQQTKITSHNHKTNQIYQSQPHNKPKLHTK